MSLFRHTPTGPVSRAFGISAVRGAMAREPGRGRPGNAPYRFGPKAPSEWVDPARDLDFPLAGLLRCAACELPLRPAEMLGGRAYGAPCGCRLMVVAADLLERLVFDAVVAREPAAPGDGAPDRAAGAAGESWAALFRRYLAEVRLGGTVDDLVLIWII